MPLRITLALTFYSCSVGSMLTPHLPAHHQPSTDNRRAVLCGIDWNGRSLGSHAQTEQNASHEQLFPGLRQR